MKTAGALIMLASSYLIVARLYFIYGYKEAQFDREIANIKLQQCYEVIRK